MSRVLKLTELQVEVLRWIGDGCPPREWPDETHKNTARALASRGLAHVGRKKKVWTAEITEAGEVYPAHGQPMPVPTIQRTRTIRRLASELRCRHSSPAGRDGSPDASSRGQHEPSVVKQTRREIKETYMRYKVVVTRVQVAERFVARHQRAGRRREGAG